MKSLAPPLKKIHRLLGLLLLAPLLIWGVTGLVFYFKPGYSEAYHQLSLQTYPLEETRAFSPHLGSGEAWHTATLSKSILGLHLLVKTQNAHHHIHYATQEAWLLPSDDELAKLIDDSTAIKRERYGLVESITRTGDNTITAHTTNDVEITLDWLTLSLRQKGPDTRLIKRLYDFHYMRFSPNQNLNKAVVLIAICVLFILTILGAALSFVRK